jgi:hypothetical protein
MEKFMKKITLIAMSLLLSNFSWAQNSCVPAQKNEYTALTAAIAFNQEDLKQILLSKYCFDFTNYYKTSKMAPGIFFAHTTNDLKTFTGRLKMDLLSIFLLNLNSQVKLNSQDKAEIYNIEKKYIPNISQKIINDTKTSQINNKPLLDFVVQDYNKNYSLPVNPQHNTPLTFAVIANEPEVLNNLMNSSSKTLYLYKKNDNGVTPIHLAFSVKKPLDKTNYNKNLIAVNTLLLDNIDLSKIKYLNMDDISFFEIVEALKDNNPDLYQKLKNKFHFNVDQHKITSQLKTTLSKKLNIVDTIYQQYSE